LEGLEIFHEPVFIFLL
jgi:hypothetical protein